MSYYDCSPAPEQIVVEADEFVSFMSAAYSAAGLIQEPLTFYRLHSENLFQVRTKDEVKQRRIQKALVALAGELRTGLASAAIAPDIIDAIVKPLDVGSKRLRLILDGGSPWETFQTQRDDFQIAYKSGSAAYWIFKGFVLGCSLCLRRGFTNFGIGTVGVIGGESGGCWVSRCPTLKSETSRLQNR
jgi:hypothetical protein